MNRIYDIVDSIIGLPTMIDNPIGNCLVAAKADDVDADTLDEQLRALYDWISLREFWFRGVDRERVKYFGHAERLLCGGRGCEEPQAAGSSPYR